MCIATISSSDHSLVKLCLSIYVLHISISSCISFLMFFNDDIFSPFPFFLSILSFFAFCHFFASVFSILIWSCFILFVFLLKKRNNIPFCIVFILFLLFYVFAYFLIVFFINVYIRIQDIHIHPYMSHIPDISCVSLILLS